MKNINSKNLIYTLFAVFSVIFIFFALKDGVQITDIFSSLKIAYRTIPILMILGAFFVTHAWRWGIFQNWLIQFPDLNGTWQGTAQSTWTNPETGDLLPPIPIVLTIKQSFTRLSCVMRSEEMTSRSFMADFWLDGDEQIRKLAYSYLSTPNVLVRERSQVHEGTAILELSGDPVNKLHGAYWTDRKTTGEITLTFSKRALVDEFPENIK